ncbi:hypothetical protein [Micromonospora sp. NPDC047527]|uniref:hypothetical protein n=1 Tax=unclassified Micromonospora TaxID=2617518 RepID=UPI0033E968F7
MKRVAFSVAGAVAATAFILVPAGAAQAADGGDGSVLCNTGEICFRKDTYGTDQMRKQFWNGANHGANSKHGDYMWFYVSGGYTTTERVMDSARFLTNRDTECTVYVWDVDRYGNWFTYASQGANSGGTSRSIDPYNNGHSRCGGSASYNPKNL